MYILSMDRLNMSRESAMGDDRTNILEVKAKTHHQKRRVYCKVV